MKKKQTEHRIVLRIRPFNKPMTEKQMKKWLEKALAGCEYGEVKVADVINEEIHPQPKDVLIPCNIKDSFHDEDGEIPDLYPGLDG